MEPLVSVALFGVSNVESCKNRNVCVCVGGGRKKRNRRWGQTSFHVEELKYIYPSTWSSWIRASWYNYENNQQGTLYRLTYYSKSALHVLGDVFTHHQEHLTVFTVSGSVHPSWRLLAAGSNFGEHYQIL